MKRLELLKKVHGQILLGPEVKMEVLDQGKAIAASGVQQVENAVDKGWIQVTSLTKKEKSLEARILANSRLDRGEAESIALAHSRKLMLIVDDKEARAHAEVMGLEYMGTAAVLLEAFIKGHLKFQQLEETVEELSKTMWLSPAVVTEILRRAREKKK
ncbi:MAG: hypothetical protein HY644_08350 [Acidobacteria bacterium]|nr:hypothetical protein [Acidobacteriota bacterium]